jgi:hypothetical protein
MPFCKPGKRLYFKTSAALKVSLDDIATWGRSSPLSQESLEKRNTYIGKWKKHCSECQNCSKRFRQLNKTDDPYKLRSRFKLETK